MAGRPGGAKATSRKSPQAWNACVWGGSEIRGDNGRMNTALAIGPSRRPAAPSTAPLLAHEPVSAWEARGFSDLVPPNTLAEARAHRDDLARLLRREHEAAADFLLALADFDRRRGWERLGHASLFAFLTRELGLSNSAAWYRQSAARLLPRFPSVEAALRDGRLCLSVVGDLSRVLTPENEAEVLPRFLGVSSRDAKEVVAAILPCPEPPRRDVVTVIRPPAPRPIEPALALPAGPSTVVHPHGAPPVHARPLLAPEEEMTHPARERRDQVEPLTADLRRLSVTVSARFLRKLAAARDGLSHAQPGATTEQVLEAALDLLLERQARRQALVKRPRAAHGKAPGAAGASEKAGAPEEAAAPTPTRAPANPRTIPAAIEREVRRRDGNRCQYPLDAGGVCGATFQLQLDHLQPLALGGATTASNLRCACALHNRRAADLELGPAIMAAARRRARRA